VASPAMLAPAMRMRWFMGCFPCGNIWNQGSR
jgi:hypothetical protein